MLILLCLDEHNGAQGLARAGASRGSRAACRAHARKSLILHIVFFATRGVQNLPWSLPLAVPGKIPTGNGSTWPRSHRALPCWSASGAGDLTPRKRRRKVKHSQRMTCEHIRGDVSRIALCPRGVDTPQFRTWIRGTAPLGRCLSSSLRLIPLLSFPSIQHREPSLVKGWAMYA